MDSTTARRIDMEEQLHKLSCELKVVGEPRLRLYTLLPGRQNPGGKSADAWYACEEGEDVYVLACRVGEAIQRLAGEAEGADLEQLEDIVTDMRLAVDAANDALGAICAARAVIRRGEREEA